MREVNAYAHHRCPPKKNWSWSRTPRNCVMRKSRQRSSLKQIKRDTGALIRRAITFRVPLLSPPLKKVLELRIAEVLRTSCKMPTHFREYALCIMKHVRNKTPTFCDHCKSYRPGLTTGELNALVSSLSMHNPLNLQWYEASPDMWFCYN